MRGQRTNQRKVYAEFITWKKLLLGKINGKPFKTTTKAELKENRGTRTARETGKAEERRDRAKHEEDEAYTTRDLC